MRRKMSRSTFLMGVGGAAALATFGARAGAQAPRPNVLVVMDDDHPPWMVDPIGYTLSKIRDPGTDFHTGATDCPLCGPARACVLTGLSITTHGCDTNATYGRFLDSPLGLEDRIAPRYLREAGYATGHFGKYVNGKGLAGVPPHWDRWCSVPGGGGEDGPERRACVDGDITDIDLRPSIWAALRCAEWVEGRASDPGRPWFAHYCPTNPHSPYDPSPSSAHLYDGESRRVASTNEGDMSDKPGWMQDLPPVERDEMQRVVEGKMEELADLDRKCVRPIVEALARSGQLGNTLVVFTSDNGHLDRGEHRLYSKDQPYWESSEVPFYARGPGVAAGRRSPALVNHTDLMPTFCDLAGVPPSALDVDGRSLAPVLGGAPAPWRRRMLVTGSADTGPGVNPGGSTGREGRWWLLMEGTKRFVLRANGFKELYFMGNDPFQKRNRAESADPSLVRRLTETVEAMRGARGEERRRLEDAP